MVVVERGTVTVYLAFPADLMWKVTEGVSSEVVASSDIIAGRSSKITRVDVQEAKSNLGRIGGQREANMNQK